MGIYGKKEKWKRQRDDLIRKTGLSKKDLTSLVIEFCEYNDLRTYGGGKWHNVSKRQDDFLTFIKQNTIKNGEDVRVYAADNRWHDATYVGRTLCGSHVVERKGEIWECAFVEPKEKLK